jgi:hypothetical protein
MRERTFFHDDGKPLWFIHESLLLAEGQDLLRRGKADEAIAMFQRATNFCPSSAASHVALARAQRPPASLPAN